MKLPSSSSILLATLAMSCSSSSLAAPTGPGDAGFASSSSNHHLSFHRGGHVSRGLYSPGTPLKRKSNRIVGRSLDHAELSTVPDLVGEVVDTTSALLHKLLGLSSVTSLDVDPAQGISPEDRDRLKSAIDGLSALLSTTDTGARSSSVAPTAPSSSSSVPSSSATPVAAAVPSNSTSAPSSAPTGANPPVVAVPFAVDVNNPPAPLAVPAPSPALTVPAPALPVPAPALPVPAPALPVPAPAPPAPAPPAPAPPAPAPPAPPAPAPPAPAPPAPAPPTQANPAPAANPPPPVNPPTTPPRR